MQVIRRNQEGEIVINLLGLFQLLWQKELQIILACIIGGGLCYGATLLLIVPKYTANVYMYANNSNSNDKTTSITTSDLNASAQLVDTYATIICRDMVLEQVVKAADIEMTTEELADCVAVSAVNSTEVFKVAVESTDPAEAALIANTIAEIAPVRIAEIVDGCSVEIVDYAKVPIEQSSPNYKLSVVLGVFLGFVIWVFVIILHEILDIRIKSEVDFQSWGLPVLCNIPEFSSASKYEGYGYGYAKKKGR